jgi:hypothetical protein
MAPLRRLSSYSVHESIGVRLARCGSRRLCGFVHGAKSPEVAFCPALRAVLAETTRLARDRSPGAAAQAQFGYFRGTDELPRPSEPFACTFRRPAPCSERKDQLRKHQKLRGPCSKGLLWRFGTPTGDA